MKKKYLFIHIAKTAGSSVNTFFENFFGKDRCATHLESNPGWRDKEKRAAIIETNRFLSGHIVYGEFAQRLDLKNYYVFAFLRDPKAHVISHLAWIRKLAEPSEKIRFLRHPKYIQDLALKMKQTDLHSPSQARAFVDGLTTQERALLDNPQVRYLRRNLGGLVVQLDVSSALHTAMHLDFIGFVEDFQNGLASLARSLGVSHEIRVPVENVMRTKFGMSVDNKELIGAFNDLIQYDLQLYESARSGQFTFSDREKQAAPFPNIFGYLDRAQGTTVSGWARDLDGDELVMVDVLINEKRVATLLADRERSDLREKFNKNCAFFYRLPNETPLVKGDMVRVVASHSGQDLVGSPVVVQ